MFQINAHLLSHLPKYYTHVLFVYTLTSTSVDHIHPSECLVNLTLAISQFFPFPESFPSDESIQARKSWLFFNIEWLLYLYKHIQALETS